MNHAVNILVPMLILAFVLAGCAGGMDSTTTSTVVSILSAALGLTPDQATAGAGSLMGLASEKLSAQDYGKVAAAIPGSADLVQKAGQMTGLGNHFGTMANVTTALGKMGIAPNQVHAIATNLGDIAGQSGGESVKGMLLGVLK